MIAAGRRLRRFLVLSALAASGVGPGTACGQTDSSALVGGPPAPARQTRPCTLDRIVDGDTIACRSIGRVRLIGMDTPERDQRPFGAMATDALRELLAGRSIALEPDVEARDRYGRTLAYVWADDFMVNWALVRLGWAVVLTYPPNVQYVEWLTQAERLAREAEAGLWSVGGFDCLPREHRRNRC